jgi:hypothetical protein
MPGIFIFLACLVVQMPFFRIIQARCNAVNQASALVNCMISGEFCNGGKFVLCTARKITVLRTILQIGFYSRSGRISAAYCFLKKL